jgi:hypothetical protein
MTLKELRSIAEQRGVDYEEISSSNPGELATRVSRVFAVGADELRNLLQDPNAHVDLFPTFRAVHVVPRDGFEGLLAENERIVVERVEEARSRLSVALFRVEPDGSVVKDILSDPFVPDDVDILSDRKRGTATFNVTEVGPGVSRLTCESSFYPKTGTVFARGLVDHVWLAFLENLMIRFEGLSSEARSTDAE